MDGSEAAGAFVADFVQEVAKQLQVTVVAPGTCNHVLDRGRVSIQRFAVPKLPLSLLRPHNPLDWKSIAQTLSAGQQTVDTLMQKNSFDHILALWALPSGYWAMKTPLQVPYSIWALGSDIWTLGKVPLVRTVLRSVLRKADLRFADGVALASDVTSISGKSCSFLSSSRVLECGQLNLKPATAPYKLVFLGRFHHNKGIDLLLQSLDLLDKSDLERIESIRIAGGGPLQADVEVAVRKLNEKGVPVSLEGYKNRDEARELLLWGDVVMIPSRIESIPVIFSDAMQAGKPVIAMPVGDLPALIHEHKVGMVAQRVDAQSFAFLLKGKSLHQAINQAPNTPAAAEKFSVAASARAFIRAAKLN